MTICHDGDALHDKFGNGPDEQTFNCMKNGNYHRWSEDENKRHSEIIVRGAYQEVALPYDLITSQPDKPHNLFVYYTIKSTFYLSPKLRKVRIC